METIADDETTRADEENARADNKKARADDEKARADEGKSRACRLGRENHPFVVIIDNCFLLYVFY